jgi:hypothetical protein
VTEPVPLSSFVSRCQDALAEYQRLRGLGIPHAIAIRSLQRVLTENNSVTRPVRDVRQAQTGEAE